MVLQLQVTKWAAESAAGVVEGRGRRDPWIVSSGQTGSLDL